jgi:hypothetical protein
VGGWKKQRIKKMESRDPGSGGGKWEVGLVEIASGKGPELRTKDVPLYSGF